MARKDTLTLKDAKRAETAGWIALGEWTMARKDTLKDAERAEAAGWIALGERHREDGPAIKPSKPTGHQLLTEAAEAMRKGEWNPADGPYQPKAWWQHPRDPDAPKRPYPTHKEPPATIIIDDKGAAEDGRWYSSKTPGVKAAAAAAAARTTKAKATKPKTDDER